MLKKQLKRVQIVVIALCLVSAMFVVVTNSVSFAQGCQPWPENCSGGGDGDSEVGIGGGGGGGSYCPIPSVTVNGKTCNASGCRIYSADYPVFVCNYRGSDGSSSDCPPLERCR